MNNCVICGESGSRFREELGVVLCDDHHADYEYEVKTKILEAKEAVDASWKRRLNMKMLGRFSMKDRIVGEGLMSRGGEKVIYLGLNQEIADKEVYPYNVMSKKWKDIYAVTELGAFCKGKKHEKDVIGKNEETENE